MAMPLHKPTDQKRQQVETMAGYGVPQKMIAKLIGIDAKTLTKHYREELDLGEAKATAKVAQTLYQAATEGNTAAMIFWMKARAGWSERQQPVAAIYNVGDASISKALEQLTAEVQGRDELAAATMAALAEFSTLTEKPNADKVTH